MTLFCPFCEQDISIDDPYAFAAAPVCPHCGKRGYVEIDETDEGPTFCLLQKMDDR